MNYKKARVWQDILLFGGAFVAGVGVWGFDSTFWGFWAWRWCCCPSSCGGYTTAARSAMRASDAGTKHCPHCGARGSATSLSRRRRKDPAQKREDENTNGPRLCQAQPDAGHLRQAPRRLSRAADGHADRFALRRRDRDAHRRHRRRLPRRGRRASCDERNLAVKAANAFCEALHRSGP